MPIIKPILSSTVEREVYSAISRYQDKTHWTAWGLNALGSQGAAILLFGPPGTGKDTIAHYLAHTLAKTIVELTMGSIGGSDPGHCERGIRKTFADAKKANFAVVFLNECEGLLWDRDQAGEDSKWMIPVIGELLQQVEKYPGLTVLATNKPANLDSALERRLLAKILVDKPAYPERMKLWQQKIPRQYPCQPTKIQLEQLARVAITGAQIVTAIRREAEFAILEKRTPTFRSLHETCKQLEQPTNQ
jgi:SpoVK/Ycf46/Vps4 family AAA+-type ATPase